MQAWAGKKDWMLYPQISTAQLSTNIHKYPQRSTKISLFFTRVSCRASRVWQETPFFIQHSYRLKISIFFLPLILRLWKITPVCDIFLKNFSVYFLRVFLVEQAEFDKKHHFSCNTATEQKFRFFLRLIFRLWKITRVCDIFFKKISVYFLRVFLAEQAEFDKKHHFFCNPARIKISIFFALDIATMEDNPRVWIFF